MIRSVLSDTQWERIAPLHPGKPGDPGRSGDNNRGFLEAVLWIARTGLPWRDLHPDFGLWNSIFRRLRRWATKGVFESLFKELSGDPDFEYAMIDGTIVRVHSMEPALKGDSKSGDRPIAWRPDDQDTRACRCARQSRALHPAAGSAT